jgi:hypothetical protein
LLAGLWLQGPILSLLMSLDLTPKVTSNFAAVILSKSFSKDMVKHILIDAYSIVMGLAFGLIFFSTMQYAHRFQ